MVLDWCFICIFLIELFIRSVGEGCSFFSPHNSHFIENMFESALVLTTTLNEITPLFFNPSIVRVARVLRVVHVVRVVRLRKAFRELRAIVIGIMGCGRTLFWSLLLLLVITYVYA